MDSKTLITGGTGTLGQALVKEIDGTIRVFSRGEYEQSEMQKEFPEVRYLIGDVRDRGRLRRALSGVDVVIHAAALKQVPTCEYNPIEAIKTNIDGSINVIETALDCRVPKVIAVSSDKAVHPINLYGATKLVMEKLFIHANVYGETKFSCVRLGNFYQSRGSFLSDIYGKEEISVTDKEMTRFWMSVTHAAQFILDCLDRMEGGEIFVPKMPQRELMDLIDELAPEVKVKVIGKRKGEKLNEMLFAEGEEFEEHGDYYVIR